jgi:uncharacterized protein YndB with AHSA1/START domain
MTPEPGATADSSEPELVITRTFDAPRELVFRMGLSRNFWRTGEVPRIPLS